MADKKPISLKGLKLKKLSTEEKSEEMSKPYKHDNRPEFTIHKKDLPQIENWNAGGKYKLVMEVEMQKKMSEVEDGKEESCGRFRIISIGAAE